MTKSNNSSDRKRTPRAKTKKKVLPGSEAEVTTNEETTKAPANLFGGDSKVPTEDEEVETNNVETEVATEEKPQQVRPVRKPIAVHRQVREDVPQREGFVRRRVVDRNKGHYRDRVNTLEKAGYSKVQECGTRTSADGTQSVVMEIPQDLYDEQQADKQQMNDANMVEKANPDVLPGQYGSIKIDQ